jgi:4-diphosphocytidyl-2-C-methyl-D-erythritol kinase
MVVFPNCKINLGLHILNKRLDGFHNLETLFYPLPLCDTLEVVSNEYGETNLGTKIRMEGIPVAGTPESNLVLKAYALLKEDYALGAVEFCLLKNIPMGAGLGGGSSDGAFAIKLLNMFFKLNLSVAQQEYYAAKLGSDCAFFIQNTPCLGTGRGEILTPITLSLGGLWIALVKPDIHIGTAEAFAKIKPRDSWDQKSTFSLIDLPNMPIDSWKKHLINDFEASIFPNHSELPYIKKLLYTHGAHDAAMSGSGSTLFGLFSEQPKLQNHFPNCFYYESKLE